MHVELLESIGKSTFSDIDIQRLPSEVFLKIGEDVVHESKSLKRKSGKKFDDKKMVALLTCESVREAVAGDCFDLVFGSKPDGFEEAVEEDTDKKICSMENIKMLQEMQMKLQHLQNEFVSNIAN